MALERLLEVDVAAPGKDRGVWWLQVGGVECRGDRAGLVGGLQAYARRSRPATYSLGRGRPRRDGRSRIAANVPSVSDLLDGHDEAGELLVAQRGEGEHTLGLRGVGGVERVGAEDQDVGDDRSRSRNEPAAQRAAVPRERRPWPAGRSGAPRRGTLRGRSCACSRSCTVWWRGRVVVGGRDVPAAVGERPSAERNLGPEQPCGAAPDPPARDRECRSGAAGPRRRGVARGADEDQRRGGVADQDVLEHVRRQQVVVADGIERRDERPHHARRARGRTARGGPNEAWSARPRRRSRTNPCRNDAAAATRNGEHRRLEEPLDEEVRVGRTRPGARRAARRRDP